jgi:hypothetical protein
MSVFRKFRQRRRELDERVAAAEAEAEASVRLLHETREHVIRPLQQKSADNHFADLIRDSLIGGNR